jgi:O-succinylbenzoic acid--CoA ligase
LVWFQTSGSEGRPKWVGLSREALLASARAVNTHLEASAADRWLLALPQHHVGGFSILARCHVSGASWSELGGKWDAGRYAAACAETGATLSSLVPTQVYDLVAARLEAPATLRAVVVGGGGMHPEVARRALELGWPVLQSFGMTETASQIATEPLAHLQAGSNPESLEVLDGWDLATQEDGRLIVRGPALAAGYAVPVSGAAAGGNKENESGPAWHWEPVSTATGVITRDRVQLWQHGRRQFLRFLGRDAAFLKVLGELVSLPALQARVDSLCLAKGISPPDVVIWPRPDDRKGTTLVLVGAIDAAVLEALRVDYNAGVTGPERAEAVKVVASIPRGPLGKVVGAEMSRVVE